MSSMLKTLIRAATAASLLALFAAGASAAPWSRKKAPPPPPPPPAEAPMLPPPSQVTVATRLVDTAGAYAGYMERASGISARFTDGASVANSLKVAETFEPRQLQQGIIAYAAMIALKDPAFVNQLRIYATDPRQANAIASRVYSDPNYVAAIPGAESAAGLVIGALNAQAARLDATGKAVKQSAYDVQHQSWSKDSVLNREARLAEAKMLSTQPMPVSLDDKNRIIALPVGVEATPASYNAAPGPYSPSVARGLTIAALAVLGRAGEENMSQIGYLLDNPRDTSCLNMSKLNLYQCLSVSKPHYEDIFCMGQHILLDTSQCVQKSAASPYAAAPLSAAVVTSVAPMAAAGAVATLPTQ